MKKTIAVFVFFAFLPLLMSAQTDTLTIKGILSDEKKIILDSFTKKLLANLPDSTLPFKDPATYQALDYEDEAVDFENFTPDELQEVFKENDIKLFFPIAPLRFFNSLSHHLKSPLGFLYKECKNVFVVGPYAFALEYDPNLDLWLCYKVEYEKPLVNVCMFISG